jgi:hypothetical protein
MITGILVFLMAVIATMILVIAEIFFGILAAALAIGIWLLMIMVAVIFIIAQVITFALSMIP